MITFQNYAVVIVGAKIFKNHQKPSFLGFTLKRQVCTITRQPLFCTPLNTATVVPMSYKDVRLGYGKEKLKNILIEKFFVFCIDFWTTYYQK